MCVGLQPALACRPGPRGSGVGDVPPNPAPLLPALAVVARLPTPLRLVCRGQRLRATANRGCGSVAIFAERNAEAEARTAGRARWCQGQSPRGSIPVPVLGMFCECLWASTTATGRQPRSRSCPIRIACSRASVLRVVSSSPRDHPRGRVCCLPSSVSNISQLIEIASRVVQPVFDGSRCGFFCCLASLGSFLAIIPCRQGGRVLGFIHEPQHSRGPADRDFPGLWAKETVAKDAFLTRTGAVG